jgi:TPR repeat protein
MRVFWKVATPLVLAAVAFGAGVIWHAYSSKAAARKLNDEVQLTVVRAQRGDAEAEEKLGGMYYYGRGEMQSYVDAMRWYRAAADQGYAKAQFDVGYLYNTGKGVQQDFTEAYRWYGLAVNKNDDRAESGLATMYYHGRGVPQDYAKAALLYRRSADQGFAQAQYDLGSMYYHGLGVTQDRAISRYWIRKAAEQGYGRARENLGMKLTPWLIFILGVQAMAGFALASGPLSFNLWEPNEGIHNSRDWLSVGTGTLFLITAGLSWYGYTHNLIWCWIYGFTGFELLKWSLNALSLILAYVVLVHNKPTVGELPAEDH